MRKEAVAELKTMMEEVATTGDKKILYVDIIPDISQDYIDQALNKTPAILITDGRDYVDEAFKGSEGSYFLKITFYIIVLMELITDINDDDFRDILDAVRDKIGNGQEYVYKGSEKGVIKNTHLFSVTELEFTSKVQ